jgi:uncharacterized tellurite resistance protein B-like protein
MWRTPGSWQRSGWNRSPLDQRRRDPCDDRGMSLLRWLGLTDAGRPESRGDADAVRRISEALERIEPARARFIAAFAYLLGRVAYADRNVTPEESRLMEQIVQERTRLPEEQAVLVVQIARGQNQLFGGTEDFLVARQFGEMATYQEKTDLIGCLFAVSAADRSITAVEDNEISRIAAELKVEHADVVRARLRHREHLEVLRQP